MSKPAEWIRIAALVLAAWVPLASSAQLPSVPGGDEETGAEQPSELTEARRKLEELRIRLTQWEAKSAEYLQAASDAEARAAAIDEDIEQLQRRDAIDVARRADASELEALRVGAEQDIALARREATELDARADQRLERRKRIPELMAVAKQKLGQLVETPAPAGSDPELEAVLGEVYELKHKVLLAEIDAYRNEIASYEVRGVLLAKQRDRATLRIAYYQALTDALRAAEQGFERKQAEEQNEASRQLIEELTAVPEGVKQTLDELYRRNEALTSLWTEEGGLHEQIDDVSEKLVRAEARVAEIEAELTSLAARVEAVGLADSIGVLLRRHRAEAPDIGMYRRFIRMRREKIGNVQLQQLQLREQRQALADLDLLVNEAMEDVDPDLPEDERRKVEALLRRLFETQREYMDALIEDYETYFQKLIDFDASQQELIDRTEDLLTFIDERILWIPSGKAVQPDLFSDGRDALAWLFGAKHWAQLGRALGDAARSLWALNLLVLLLAVALLVVRRRIGTRIGVLADEVSKPTCVRLAPTAEAIGLSILVALWLPALLGYVGWRLDVSPAATQFTRSVASALVVTAALWASLRLPRQLVRARGIAEAHCEWPSDAAQSLWRSLRWLIAITVPAAFLIAVFEMRGEDLWRESVGRVAFAIMMLTVLVFNHAALRSGGWVQQVFGDRGRRAWLWAMLRIAAWLVPFALAVAEFRGFYWTALQFSIRLHFTLVFVFLLAVSIQLVARSALIAARRAAREEEALEEKTPEVPPKLQVSRLMVGTGVLLAFIGTFGIWAELLPAVRILDQVELWSVTQTVTVSELEPSGVERLTTDDRLVPVTLADLFRSLLIGLLTLAVIRALPGLLEATLFRRLGPGERYAFSTIAKYAVALGGLAFAFDGIGIGWSSIQWLVAAIGIGLGFGLQEIFANFISGLIILLERPIRVGDTVSVGGINGTVSKIRIRATWITAFDRKELIVPNKTFVTGELVNWTLSDPVLRISVTVGIAYGSDTEKAIEVLERVARETPYVLRDPRPEALFLEFGDSSLSFELRAFVRTTERLFPTRHQLHMRIDKAFREAGIEIAFPQRDLHVRSMPDGWGSGGSTGGYN